jgi:hypothetical protein
MEPQPIALTPWLHPPQCILNNNVEKEKSK